MIKTSILFLLYNRPNLTKETFKAIRKAEPKYLYIAADGPKNNLEDRKLCQETREITEKINWQCEVKRFYSQKNIGLKASVYGAITWFFSNVEEGIILEDDCVPDKSFFIFCEEMLQKYRDDENVMHISGSNFLSRSLENENGYYFSKYDQVWGWATWRRAWKKMDYDLSVWKKFEKTKKYNSLFPYLWERKYWHILLNAVMKEKINSWAYRWQCSIWENGGKAVTPGTNLVKNIGLSVGTHINTNVGVLGRSAEPIRKNPVFLGDRYSNDADKYTMKNEYRISPLMVFLQWAYYLPKNEKK